MTNQPVSRRKKLGYFSKTIFLVNIIAVIALLLSYSAAYIDPVSFWPLAFFGFRSVLAISQKTLHVAQLDRHPRWLEFAEYAHQF